MNYALLHAINGLSGKFIPLDWLMIFSAKYLIYFVGLYLIYFFLKGNTERRYRLVNGLIASIIGIFINTIIGMFFYVARPFVAYSETVHMLVNHATNSSFPSTHVTILFSFASVLFFLKKKTGIYFGLIGILIGFARIYVGIHYPFDILGGMIFGTIIGYLCHKFRSATNHFVDNIQAIFTKEK